MNKKLAIPLLLLVLLIWGWIFYKVIYATQDNLLPAAPVVTQIKKKKVISTPDSLPDYEPKGNYRDPFLAEEELEEEVPVQDMAMAESAIPPPQEPYIDWSTIKYLGEVSSASNKKKIVLVGLNEKDFMMKEGDTREGITLLQNTAGYIKIKYQGQENVITK